MRYIIIGIIGLLLINTAVFAGPTREFKWYWFIYENEKTGDIKTCAYRPFYLKTGSPSRYFESALMPLFFWHYHDPIKDDWKWLFGLGGSMKYTHVSDEAKQLDIDVGFFPFLFFGLGTNPSERYFMLWPVGGVLKNKFVTDRISAWCFPGFLFFAFFPPSAIFSYTTVVYIIASMLPVYMTYEWKDFKAWNIMWPLIYRGKGDNRDEIRVLPFYAHMHKKGWYDKYSILFFFNYQRYHYMDDIHETFFFFPFFGRKWSKSGRVWAYTVIWPFFSWGFDRRTRDWQVNAPWPLIQLQDKVSPRIHKRIFFPFYGYYRYADNETTFITPLYFHLKKHSYQFDSEQYFFALVLWYYKRDYHNKADEYYGKRWRYLKLWPVFSAEWNETGDFFFNMLSILPFRDREGYEKLYQPLWSIVEYERYRDGEQRFGILFRTYYQRWGPGFFYAQVPFVFSVGWRDGRLKECTFLFYMFGYSSRQSGEYLRLFWVPIRIGPGDPSMDDESDYKTPGDVSLRMEHPPLDAVRITYRF